jgi:L-cystine uptake protein TcyP (sodium:dicarboxylate symporter family)
MATVTPTTAVLGSHHHGRWYQHLYVQVLTAIVLGVLLGHFYPSLGEAMKPLGDAFIKMIKMLIAPIIFFTVVHGIASMKDMKKVGRVGLKALIYFEVVTTLALVIGLIVVSLWQPMAAGRRHEYRPLPRRHLVNRDLHHESEGPEYHCVPDGDHPVDRRWRLCDW